MSTYRVIASDMDETFLASDHSIPQANLDALERMHELGVLFVPASGRAYGSVMDSLAGRAAELLQDSFVISYNGGTLTRIRDGATLTTHTLPFDKVEALFRHGVELGLCVHLYESDGTVWVYDLVRAERDYLAGHMDVTEFFDDDLSFLKDRPISKMLYMSCDFALLHKVGEELGTLADSTSTTYSSGRYLEFNPEGVDKGLGLRTLAGRLGVDLADTIALGDSLNDLPMLEAAGIGACVSNRSAEIAGRCDCQLRSSCDDGALAEVLERFVEV